jgi:hypothetical protein
MGLVAAGRTDDSGVKAGVRESSLSGYLYVNVVSVGIDGGRRPRTTWPFPGLANDDANGE